MDRQFRPRVQTRRSAFTLVELLAVIAIIALLAGLLIPVIASSSRAARASACLANVRALQMAHLSYAEEHKGFLADARLPHGGADLGSAESFVATLQPFLDNQLQVMRSPLDGSPHWSVEMGGSGVPVTGSTSRFRRTSYGINNHLSREFSALGALDPARVTDRIGRIPNPAMTVHTVCMATTGDFAGADHPHVEEWGEGAASAMIARTQLSIASVGGTPAADARSNYGFADGHVATEMFGRVYASEQANAFDPFAARTFRP
ncbi:MAG: prepilin-type N-terminal cleavage/methylation domain-containing protein [Planctomycetes bacterium]|nr:prepilin-type N-terminal cleavage/methylation domain-containing protein [Planctomycetota bacterium]